MGWVGLGWVTQNGPMDNSALVVRNFYPRDAMLARVLAIALCPSVCLSQVGVLSNGKTNRAGFWHGSFIRPILHCVVRKFMYLQK